MKPYTFNPSMSEVGAGGSLSSRPGKTTCRDPVSEQQQVKGQFAKWLRSCGAYHSCREPEFVSHMGSNTHFWTLPYIYTQTYT